MLNQVLRACCCCSNHTTTVRVPILLFRMLSSFAFSSSVFPRVANVTKARTYYCGSMFGIACSFSLLSRRKCGTLLLSFCFCLFRFLRFVVLRSVTMVTQTMLEQPLPVPILTIWINASSKVSHLSYLNGYISVRIKMPCCSCQVDNARRRACFRVVHTTH